MLAVRRRNGDAIGEAAVESGPVDLRAFRFLQRMMSVREPAANDERKRRGQQAESFCEASRRRASLRRAPEPMLSMEVERHGPPRRVAARDFRSLPI